MKVREMAGGSLREVMVKIGLERIDTQEGITVEALLDSKATRLVMSSEFARKQAAKLCWAKYVAQKTRKKAEEKLERKLRDRGL